jgi:hypothetical protein
MGLEKWDEQEAGIPEAQRAMLQRANEILGFV